MVTTPAGWYDDPERPGQQRYWDGAQWTDQRQPTPPPAAAPAPPSAAYPMATPEKKNSHTTRNVILAVVGVLVLLMGGCTVALVVAGGNAVNTAIDESIDAVNESGGSNNSADGDSSFADDVLTTPDQKIVITKHEVIQPGDKGNEYGRKPVISFWYKTTNLTNRDLDPTTAWMFTFTAYQDNNPNAENELEVGSLPDDRFLDSQLENIKKGGTVENAVAYELDDLKTPVELVAVEGLIGDEIGRESYEVN